MTLFYQKTNQDINHWKNIGSWHYYLGYTHKTPVCIGEVNQIQLIGLHIQISTFQLKSSQNQNSGTLKEQGSGSFSATSATSVPIKKDIILYLDDQ